MPQLQVNVSEETADTLERQAKEQGVSVSSYIADVLQKETARAWPPGYFETVIGGWQGEPLERAEQGEFEQREGLD